MPVRDLPNNPSIEHLRQQARTLQRQVRAGVADAHATVGELHPRPAALAEPDTFSLADAQLVIARRYGFASWPKLRHHLDVVERYARSPHRPPAADADDLEARFLRLACLGYGGDRPARREEARRLLADHPELATASIHTMAAVGEVAAATALLAEDPSQATAEGGPHRWEPLLYAAYSRLDSPEPGHSTLAVARLLLAHGADPNAGYLWEGTYPFTALTGVFGGGEDGEGNLPPHEYASQLARLLLDAGADPNDSQTLYNRGLGGSGGDLSHVRLLLEYGLGRGDGGPWHARLGAAHASPAQLLEDELLRAAKHDVPELARLMIDHGVDVDGYGTRHPAFGGHTAYELAMIHGNREIADLLATAAATTTTLDPVQEFAAACLQADRAAVERLLAAEPGLAAEAIRREPYLVGHAAGEGHTDAVRLMVSLGFDPDLGDALVFANGGAVVAGLLSDFGDEVNVVRRTTALHLAAWAGHLETVEALVELGADATLRDCEHDSTPLGWAEYNHQQEVAAYLAGLPR
jgi:ankyrin repeat protein